MNGPVMDTTHASPLANILALLLFVFGLTQMAGYVLDSKPLRGIGAASLLAPLPKVFSDVDGYEPFAARFIVMIAQPDGTQAEIPITPELYGRLAGPYKRRNVYGAAVSYAPRLPASLRDPVLCYAFAQVLPSELSLPKGPAKLRIETATRGRLDTWTIEAAC